MKKLFLTTLCVLGLFSAATTVSAQEKLRQTITDIAPDWMPPFKLGITAGVNASTFSHGSILETNGAVGSYNSLCGFQIGVDGMADMSSLLNNTYLRSGLLLVRKGAKYDAVNFGNYTSGGSWYERKTKFRPYYLQIPVRYGYGYVLDPDCIFFGEAGPYVAVGLGGKSHTDELWRNSHNNEEYTKDFFDYADRFDFGFGFHAGVIICKHHQLSIGYDFGLLNMSDNYSQNRSLMLSYSYYIK